MKGKGKERGMVMGLAFKSKRYDSTSRVYIHEPKPKLYSL
jgi:hypothetical protein